MTEKLKSCPFCGKNHLWTYSVSYAPEGLRFVKCAIDPEKNDGCVSGVPVSIWQKRPIEDKLSAENEKLKEALREIANMFSDGGIRTVTMAHRCVAIAQEVLKEVTK